VPKFKDLIIDDNQDPLETNNACIAPLEFVYTQHVEKTTALTLTEVTMGKMTQLNNNYSASRS
jgi:hypothetical protein